MPDSLLFDEETVLKELFVSAIDLSSDEVPSISGRSSLTFEIPVEDDMLMVNAEGMFYPGSGEICSKYIPMSNSDALRHPYYNYPAVLDPGIKEALLGQQIPAIYANDGQELYKALCEEMKTCIVRSFYNGLVTNDINLSYYGVNPNAIRSMALALQYNRTVQNFNLTDNFLNDDACYHLGIMLTSNTTIKKLNLSGCRIGLPGIIKIGSTLVVNRSLEEINLSRNCLGEEGGVEVAKQIGDGAGVPHVNLSNNRLGKLTALALKDALEFRNKITHIDLSWNNFYHIPSIVKLLAQFADSEVLEELNLSWNSLEGECVAEAIVKIFVVPTLKTLVLSNNRFQGKAIKSLISNLISAKKLTTFDLSFNPLSTTDVYSVLEKMLLRQVKLEKLLLNGIPVDKEFVKLLEIVKRMKSRKNFSIEYGRVSCNWDIQGPDARVVILDRANYLGWSKRVDIGLYILALNDEFPEYIPVKTLVNRTREAKVPLDEDLINELAEIFPGPKSSKSRLININAICDFIHRMWPHKKLPTTAPPKSQIKLELPKVKAKEK